MKKKKSRTLSSLKKSLDTIFSRYIRLKDANDNGFVECYTCGVKKPWKQVDAGHFQSRRYLATRWNELNVKPQCKKCNIFNNGEQYTFGKLLDVREKEGTSDKLYSLARTTVKYMRCDYEEMIEYYKIKVEKLLDE